MIQEQLDFNLNSLKAAEEKVGHRIGICQMQSILLLLFPDKFNFTRM